MPMSTSQARVVDPVLSNLAIGYSNPDYIGSKLFPIISCPKRGVRVIKFGKEGFRLHATRRAPGADTARVSYGYLSDPVALHQEALEAVVPREFIEEAAGIPVDVSMMHVNLTQDAIFLQHEHQCASLAQDAGNYGVNNKVTLAGNYWDAPATDLKAQMKDYRGAIRSQIGRNPNVLMLPNDVFEALKSNEQITSQFKYTSSESITAQMMANFFEVSEVVVGQSLKLADDEVTLEDLWSKVVLAYVAPAALRGMPVPSYGYTYRLKGYPIVERSYYDDRAKSHIHPVTDEMAPLLTGQAAGFLISQPLTP